VCCDVDASTVSGISARFGIKNVKKWGKVVESGGNLNMFA
jgi:hypothetical protein